MDRSTRIVVIGAGIGGLTVAGLLQRQGFDVVVCEQAENFSRIGAGIILGASSARVMRRLGLEDAIKTTGIEPDAFVSRDVVTGEILNEQFFDSRAEEQLDGSFVNIHRADLHHLLVSALRPETIRFNHRLVGISDTSDRTMLSFEGGSGIETDIVIGADGIRSMVREVVVGHAKPRYTGKLALRAVFPSSRVSNVELRDCTKWWGEDRHLLSYYMTSRRDECYVMAAIPSDTWTAESLPKTGSREDFLEAFPDCHHDLRALLEATDNVSLLPICDRPRNDTWSRGRLVLLGDACHPVRPFMAAGGAMAIEDAAILARAIESSDSPEAAFTSYARARIPRVADVQRISEENSWMKRPGDTSWFFGYDPYTEMLTQAA